MEIFCKLDNLQRTGSFKERGARNALAQLPPEQQRRGVIAASAGNHAQALAYQGKLLGVPATVVMPTLLSTEMRMRYTSFDRSSEVWTLRGVNSAFGEM